MEVISSKIFINNSSATLISETLSNPNSGDTLMLEVYGNASGFILIVEGSISMDNSSWTQLGWYDSLVNQGSNITSNGIYTIPIQCISKVRVRLTQITSGSLTAYGKVGA